MPRPATKMNLTYGYRKGEDGRLEAKIFELREGEKLPSGWEETPPQMDPKDRKSATDERWDASEEALQQAALAGAYPLAHAYAGGNRPGVTDVERAQREAERLGAVRPSGLAKNDRPGITVEVPVNMGSPAAVRPDTIGMASETAVLDLQKQTPPPGMSPRKLASTDRSDLVEVETVDDKGNPKKEVHPLDSPEYHEAMKRAGKAGETPPAPATGGSTPPPETIKTAKR
jgi:hypothetical protein